MTKNRGEGVAHTRRVTAVRIEDDASLLERASEIAAIRSALDGVASGTGNLIVIEGEPGIGKSALIERALDIASAHGVRVVRARGGELETRIPYGIVLDLFALMLRRPKDRARWLTGLAAAAAPVFSPAETPAPADPLSAVHGLYWLTVELSDEAPLLLVVDDLHWADDPSLRYLSYLAQRIHDLPVLLLAGVRPPEDDEPPALASLRSHPRAVKLVPGRLSEAAVGQMMAAHGRPLTGSAVRACWAATRGNPLYVEEMLRRSDDLGQLAPPDDTSEPLNRAIRRRIGLLSHEPRVVAEAVAILGHDATVSRVASVTGFDAPRTDELVRRLVNASILDRESQLQFIHPIVRTLVVEAIPQASRATLERIAARILADEGASVEAVATHLVGAERAGDPRAVSLLRHAAELARAQGDAAAAILYLQRALAEPPPAAERRAVLAELAAAEASIGAQSALDHYDEALSLTDDERDRAQLLLQLGHARIATADWAGAAAVFREGLDLAADADADLAGALESAYISSAWVSMIGNEETNSRLERVLSAQDITLPQRELLVSWAFQRVTTASGTADELARLALDAIAPVPIDDLVRRGQIVELTTGVLFTTDELEREIELLDRAIDAVPRTGAFAKLGVYSYCRAWPKYIMGRLVDAAADAQAAVRASEMGWETFFPVASAVLAYALLERGDLDGAQRAIDAVDDDRWGNRIDYTVFVPIAKGRIVLASGDATSAAKHFLAAGEAATSVGMQNPGPPDWRSWAAISLARSGRRDEALHLAEEGAAIARSWGARWPLAIALKALGLVTGGPEGLELLNESVAVARSSPARLEVARTLLEQGAALRRLGHLNDARRALTESMDVAHALGAHRIQERARRELVVAGSRPRRYAVTGIDALTPAEWRVADLVAAGSTNREAAEALFVTPKAVEYHLANAYRKLGIGSRQELAAALTKPEAQQAASV